MTEVSPLQETPEAQSIMIVASALHEEWRKTRLKEDGSYEPRIKGTRDEAWITIHGTDQVDIANTVYSDLPENWQVENREAARVVVGILRETSEPIDLSDPTQRSYIGSKIHDAWLSRNDWAKNGKLDIPFDQLPDDEQAKDLDQVIIAQQVL